MGGPFRRGNERRERRRANQPRGGRPLRADSGSLQEQARLPPTGQFRIDFGEKFRIKQGAMFGAPAGIDTIALAERIKTRGGAGMAAARQSQSIDNRSNPRG